MKLTFRLVAGVAAVGFLSLAAFSSREVAALIGLGWAVLYVGATIGVRGG